MSGITLVSIANKSYIYFENITNSRIVFKTQPELIYTNLNVPVFVAVGIDLHSAVCRTLFCQFSWTSSITPTLTSVMPQIISGPTNVSLIGGNLFSGSNTYSDVHLSINGIACIVIAMNSSSINCSIDGVEAGNHSIIGYIDSMLYFSLRTHL